MTDLDLAAITEEAIKEADTAQLRAWAGEHLADYEREQTVVRFELTAELVRAPGSLTVIDNALRALQVVYADRGGEVTTEGGYNQNSISLTVWSDDAGLRQRLRYSARNARERVGENA